jgi:hypothetical protein
VVGFRLLTNTVASTVWFSDWSTKLSWNEQGFAELLTGLSVGGVKYSTLFFTNSAIKAYIKYVLVKSNPKSGPRDRLRHKALIMTTANNAAKFNNFESNCPRVYIFRSARFIFQFQLTIMK